MLPEKKARQRFPRMRACCSFCCATAASSACHSPGPDAPGITPAKVSGPSSQQTMPTHCSGAGGWTRVKRGFIFPILIEMLVKHRAFRFLLVLSPASIADPDLSARRAMAAAVCHDILLPIVAAPFEKDRLDAKTRALEFVHFEESWATGLKDLLDVLAAARCPRSASGGIGIALRSFMPPDVISHQPETLYSNRFRPAVPDAILRFTATTAIGDDRFYPAQLQWAFRRVDPHNFLAFHPPPDALRDAFTISANSTIEEER